MNAYLTERSDLLQQFWSIRNIICILKKLLAHILHFLPERPNTGSLINIFFSMPVRDRCVSKQNKPKWES